MDPDPTRRFWRHKVLHEEYLDKYMTWLVSVNPPRGTRLYLQNWWVLPPVWVITLPGTSRVQYFFRCIHITPPLNSIGSSVFLQVFLFNYYSILTLYTHHVWLWKTSDYSSNYFRGHQSHIWTYRDRGGSGKGIPCRHLFLLFSLPILELIEDWGHVKQFFQKPLDFKEGGSVGKQLGQRLVEFGSRTFWYWQIHFLSQENHKLYSSIVLCLNMIFQDRWWLS